MGHTRVRFAPSPTGYLHIGGARTAIYNWLFARKTGGVFILRIEDTDVSRGSPELVQGILDGLRWLGLDWDEGPYFQSQYAGEHREAAQKLLESAHAYRCFCTPDELKARRERALAEKRDVKYDGTCRNLSPEEVKAKEDAGVPFAIRFKMPEGPGSVAFRDEVYGPIEKRFADLEDFVVVRSDGSPLYILSNAVDDIRDGITHIIRGQDGLANTPKQILIYEALGKEPPVFAHMSFTLDPKRAKISKRRHGEVATVEFYRTHGFIPWAVLNFLVLLGWSTPDDREFFDRAELIRAFSLEGVGKASSVFNFHKGDPKFITDPKLMAINAHYLRTMELSELAPLIRAEMEAAGIWDDMFEGAEREWFLATVDLIRSRYHLLSDFVTEGAAYFSDEFPMNENALNKNLLKSPELAGWLPELADEIDALEGFTLESTEGAIRGFADKKGVKAGVIINGVRAAVTGQLKGPGLFDVLIAVGKDRVVRRLREVGRYY